MDAVRLCQNEEVAAVLVAIVACEVGFWVLLAAGLGLRYGLRMTRTSTLVLLAVPVVDVALLAFTVVDLRRGTPPETTHALAAVYLGFSVAFGHALVRWADVRVAHRFAGGPPPAPKPASGTAARARLEWRDWGRAVLGVAVTAAVLGVMVLGVGPRVDATPLFGMLPGLGIALVVWLVGWPVAESAKAARR